MFINYAVIKRINEYFIAVIVRAGLNAMNWWHCACDK